MNKKKHLGLNFSNQGNLCSASETTLSQYNFGVIIGLGFLNRTGTSLESRSTEKIPISISLDKSGEVELTGINDIDDNNVQIYTDKKITKG